MRKPLLLIVIALSVLSARGQVTVALGSALEVESGTKVHIPVVVTGIDAANGGIPIIAAEFHIFYDNLNVEYDTTENFSSITPSTEWIFGSSGTEYGTSWIDDNLLPVSFPDGTVLFEIVFDYKGGTAILDLDSTRCYLVDANTTNIPVNRVIDGVITPSAGSDQSVWNGTGDWNTSSNWSNGVPGVNTLAVIESGNSQILSNANCKTLTINGQATVQVMPGFALTVSDNIVNNGSFTIESDATGTGSVILDGQAQGNGAYFTRQFIGSESEHLVSSPLPSTPGSVFDGLLPEVYAESSGNWQPMTGSGLLQSAGGVRISTSSATPVILSFSGPFNTSDVTASLAFTASNPDESRGLNLVGNPFSSAIFANLASWNKTGTANGVYVWDGYRYKCWNGTIGDLTDGIIPAMQGFFVRAEQSGASIAVPAAARLHSNIPLYKKAEDDQQNLLVFRFENRNDAQHADQAFIHINEGSVSDYSSDSDVIKLQGSPDFPQLSTVSADQVKLSINCQPDFSNSIPLVLEASDAGLYQLTITGAETIPNDVPLFLEDTQDASNIWNFRLTPSVTFNLAAGENTGNRYVLHFKSIGIDDIPADFFSVFAGYDHINIASRQAGAVKQVDLFSPTGSLLYSDRNVLLPESIVTAGFAGGVVILRLVTHEGVFTKKLILSQ